MVLLTLREMAKGGMNDQLGGGFHRYSVDERWFVPHFEKMLYDQAQLAVSYLEAFQITRDGQYAAAARDIFSYVQRDLAHPDGGFYSAEDADSAADAAHPREKREGAFYVWTAEEIEATLAPPRRGDVLLPVRRRSRAATSRRIRTANFAGRTFCIRRVRSRKPPRSSALTRRKRARVLKNASANCWSVRSGVRGPHLDDKILAAWNGLMISAFAKGAQILDEPRSADAAQPRVNFIRRELWDEDRADSAAPLSRRRIGDRRIPRRLRVPDSTRCWICTRPASKRRFSVRGAPGRAGDGVIRGSRKRRILQTAAGADDLVLRLKDDYDGAEPSGNSAMALALLRLARMTDRADFRAAAERTLEAFSRAS